MSHPIRTPKPARWAPALGSLVLLAALAAAPMGAGASERSAAPPAGKVMELRQVGDRALDSYVRPGGLTGARAQAGEVLAAADPAPSAEKILREIARPSVLSDAHAAVTAVPQKAARPSFVADAHAATVKVLTDAQSEATKALRTLVPGSG